MITETPGAYSAGSTQAFVGERAQECKYGENAWQTPAALYTMRTTDPLALDNFRLVAGTAPSYNNLCDVDRLLQTMTHAAAGFDVNTGCIPPIVLGGKHGNCCGASAGVYNGGKLEVVERMLLGDLRAIFGGLVMLNFEVDEAVAQTLLTFKMPQDKRRLLDGIIAPHFTPAAVEMLKRKGDKCRFLENPALQSLTKDSLDTALRFRYVRGGFLTQPNYTFVLDLNDSALEKDQVLGSDTKWDMILAWAIGSTSNSNTITLVKDGMLLGNGVGQQDRVTGANLAVFRAHEAEHLTAGAVAYSDSFFPFTDGLAVLAEARISAVLATSGSMQDDSVKQFCQANGITLYLIPDAKARGFCAH